MMITITNWSDGTAIYSVEAVDLREAVRRAVKNRVSLAQAELLFTDLSRAYLCGASLRGANLHGADLCESDLRRADLRDADLREAVLCRAKLRGAKLRGAAKEKNGGIK